MEFGLKPTFSGKIWMLTDSRMASAAQMAAWISMETNFATHVGGTTGGGVGGLRTLALGLDALETTLALIEEGGY